MGRFRKLRKYLSFSDAFNVYYKQKTRNLSNIRISKLKHPFSLRQNVHDYFTFHEVLLLDAYDIPLDYTPHSIIDGGGNIGLTAAFFATKYPEAKILTIEPDAENFALLKQNTSAYKNIEGLNGAVWHRPANLIIKDLGIGSNGFTVEEASAEAENTIQAWSISDLMQKMSWTSCDLVKLDVEGSEKEIFSNNFESWLPKTKTLVIELHDRIKKDCSKTVFASINQYNFSMRVAGENLVFRNEDLK